VRLAFLLLTSVYADVAVPAGPVPALNSQITAAPSEVIVSAVPLVLRASLNRDFMPSVPPGGKAMTGEVSVAHRDWRRTPYGTAETLPFVVDIQDVWIVKGTVVMWRADSLHALHRYLALPSKSFWNGPKLEPGSSVDVVVRFAVGRRTYFIRAAGVHVLTSS
jgi:hypothetical protein